MLGIRNIKGVVLDFWVGSPLFFSCDKTFVIEGEMDKFAWFMPQSSVSEAQKMHITEVNNLSSINFNEGHFAFSPQIGCTADELINYLNDKVIDSHKGRVTIICSDLETYERFFAAFQKNFPENI